MLILHLLSSTFLFSISKKLTQNSLAGLLSVTFFSVFPVAIYFQRRVLLDNIMTFWLLASLFFIVQNNFKLHRILISAVLFGVAILTKETAVVLIPIYIYSISVYSHLRQKIFAIGLWLVITLLISGLYVLYALLKGEFLPYGSFLGGNSPHVSLLETIKFQLNRDGGGILDPESSLFWGRLRDWFSSDPTLIVSGILATIINLVLGIKLISNRLMAFYSVSLWVFLLRGGLVLDFYIIPLIPFLALNIVGVLMTLKQAIAAKLAPPLKQLSSVPIFALSSVLILLCFISSQSFSNNLNLFTSDQTTPQKQAVDWILSRERPEAAILIDDYAYIDLHVRNRKNFKFADWYWKADLDPQIRNRILRDGIHTIDYLAVTPQMEHDITQAGLDITGKSIGNAQPLVRFWKDDWGVTIWSTKFPQRILAVTWETYKKRFIHNGRTVDPQQANVTTSEGQAYTLLRAVYMNDKATFDKVWRWTKEALQKENGLFRWKWQETGFSIVDEGSATDADSDIALSLIFAAHQWNSNAYQSEARRIIQAIWEYEVVTVGDTPYLMAGEWGNQEQQIVFNPSYFSPATYKIFADVDSIHPWNEVVDSSYTVISECTQAKLDKQSGVLPPEWCALDKTTSQFTQPQGDAPNSTVYGYNAFRVPWRVALDYLWFKDQRAKDYLTSQSYLYNEWVTKKALQAAYEHDGKVWENYESVAAYGANIAQFLVISPKIAKEIYETKILTKYFEDNDQSYWDDLNNYYTQNWAWFGTALYTNSFANLAQK